VSFFRVLLAIIFPPLSVIDKGCGSVLIVFLLTLAGWIPGVIQPGFVNFFLYRYCQSASFCRIFSDSNNKRN
jgi:uncharacterized membrane protein YqaE (UPF0057 family)